MDSMEWSVLEENPEDKKPIGRDDYSGCFDSASQCLFVFGGYVMGSKVNDLWKFDLGTGQWECLNEGDN